MDDRKCRVLVIGVTGYIGRHIAKASIRLGYPTFLLIRKAIAYDEYKAAMVVKFKRNGAKILEGSFDDHESLVDALKQVDVVICAIAEKNLLDQLKLIDAIKQAGNIKRFLPSEFGMDPDRMDHAIAPGNRVFLPKKIIRRAIEEASIPYTYVSANCFAGYFLSGIAQLNSFMPPRDKVVIYGSGDAKAIWVDEDDVGTFVLSTVDDPRTLNKSVYIRPPNNILSQREVVEIWEKKIGKTLDKSSMSEKDMFKAIAEEGTPLELKTVLAHFYQIFCRGDLLFDLGENDRDACELYPDVIYTSVDTFLERYA